MRDRIYKKISSILSNRDSAYNVLVNNRLLTKNKNLVYLRYNRTEKQIEFCSYVKINGKQRLVADDSLKDTVLNLICDTKILGEDLHIDENIIDVNLDFNNDLGIVNIKNNVFMTLLEKIYVEDVPRLQVDNFTVEGELRDRLYSKFDNYSITAYNTLYDRKLLKYLKSKAKYDINLRKYYIFDVYRPILIEGTCVFNPLLSVSKYNRVIKESDLFNKAKDNVISVSGLFVYYITDKNLCDTMHLKYTRLNARFINKVLLGLFNDSFPNKKVFYLNRYNSSVINSEQYVALSLDDRQEYMETNSLLLFCASFSKHLGGDLYAKVKEVSLF